MATVTNSAISCEKLHIEFISQLATQAGPFKATKKGTLSLRQYQPSFSALIGEKPSYSLLFSTSDSSRTPFFHGGCAYIESRDEVYATSDLLPSSNSSLLPSIVISKISLKRRATAAGQGHDNAGETRSSDVTTADWAKLRPPPNMPMPAGAAAKDDGILFCSQGNFTKDTGGVYYMPLGRPPSAIATHFFGKSFNSIQGIACDRNSVLWFTDSDYGHIRDIRPKPQLRNHVYRYDPNTGDLRVVADGIGRPRAIAVSPDGQTMYITDTEAREPDGTLDERLGATIYAYDVVRRPGGEFLSNKRVFAYPAEGVASAVTCDSSGNVYAACGDGIEIWSAEGMALGLLVVPGGCSGLCFGLGSELFVCAGQSLWRVQLNVPHEH